MNQPLETNPQKIQDDGADIRLIPGDQHVVPLSDCPMCGQPAQFVWHHMSMGRYAVRCTGCGLTLGPPHGYSSRLDLCADWNRRDVPAPDKLLVGEFDFDALLRSITEFISDLKNGKVVPNGDAPVDAVDGMADLEAFRERRRSHWTWPAEEKLPDAPEQMKKPESAP
jgi:hypothetical protein